MAEPHLLLKPPRSGESRPETIRSLNVRLPCPYHSWLRAWLRDAHPSPSALSPSALPRKKPPLPIPGPSARAIYRLPRDVARRGAAAGERFASRLVGGRTRQVHDPPLG